MGDREQDDKLVGDIKNALVRSMSYEANGTRIIVLTKHGRAYTMTANEHSDWDVDPELDTKICGQSIYDMARIAKKIMEKNPSKCSVGSCPRPAMGLLCVAHYSILEDDARDLYKNAISDEEKATVVRMASEMEINPEYDVWSMAGSILK